MIVDRQTYLNMNRAYNDLFDNWKQIADIDPKLNKSINMAMVLLDQALDAIKEAAPPKQPTGGKQDTATTPSGWSVIRG